MKLLSVESVLAARICSEYDGSTWPWVFQPNRDQQSESSGHDIVIEPRGCDVSRAASDVGVASMSSCRKRRDGGPVVFSGITDGTGEFSMSRLW
jgi:hypothetical protein